MIAHLFAVTAPYRGNMWIRRRMGCAAGRCKAVPLLDLNSAYMDWKKVHKKILLLFYDTTVIFLYVHNLST